MTKELTPAMDNLFAAKRDRPLHRRAQLRPAMLKREKPVTIRLSRNYARLLMQNIDGWLDAGACKGGLEPAENRALSSAYNQIQRQIVSVRQNGTAAVPSE